MKITAQDIETWDEKTHGGKRKCQQCEKFFPFSQFVKNETSRKKQGGYCPKCRQQYQHAYYVARKAKMEKMKTYWLAHHAHSMPTVSNREVTA